MDIKTLRWTKTRQLVSKAGGISRFADKIGRSQQQANRFAGPNPVAGIGNKIARLIEQSFGLDHGYLDKMESDESANLSAPFSNQVDALDKADRAAELFIKARNQWLKIRPEVLHVVRSALRNLLIDNGIYIQSESDKGFIVSRFGQLLRLDLHIPLTGHAIYHYESISKELPDVLALPVRTSSSELGFYFVPKAALEEMSGNTALSLNADSTRLNNKDISLYLNNLAPLI